MKSLLLLLSATILHAVEKPNIVIIYAADLGYGDVSCYNPDRGKIPTPHIDKLAAQGMKFTDGHSSSGVCSPSRYTILTGRYHWRGRLQGGIVGMWVPPAIAPDRLTIGSLAKQNGYRTACIGKWHLGWDWPIPRDKRDLMSGSKQEDIAATEEQKTFWKELFSQPIPGGPVDRGLGPYADFVMETDAIVGQVIAALGESGEADNTLVIFTSDNGCAHYIGMEELEAQGHFASGPLRGAKSDAWEGGHRVPFIVRWPGVVEAGAVSGQLVHQADLMRTFADAMGVELPDNAGEDSFSLLPLMKGTDKPVRSHAVSNSIRGVPAVRDGHWKHIAVPGSGGWGQGGDQSQPVQLYNLADDLGETNNLADEMPEKLAEMQTLLETLITDGRSTPGAQQKNDAKVVRYPM